MATTLSEQFELLCKKHDLSAISFSCHAADRSYDRPYYFVTLTWGDIPAAAQQNCSGCDDSLDKAFQLALAEMQARRQPARHTGIESASVDAQAA